MINKDENALICDFAETYHIYDYKALRPMQAAILAVGLPSSSRIKRKLAGQKHSDEIILLSCIADALRLLVWFKTADGQKNINRPQSILQELIGEKDEYAEYSTVEAYEAARANMMEI